MFDDAVEEVEALVVIGLGGNKLLENSEQSGLKGKKWDHVMIQTPN